jgi:3-oxoacyl-[acyl-carrier protein] reductase
VALRLAARKLDLVLLGRPSAAHAETAATLRRAGSGSVHEIFADFADAAALEAAASKILRELGTPDVVVHNAGLVVRASILETSAAAWDEQLDVNLRAPFVLSRAFLPSMLARRSGRFVFLGSISGTLGSPGAAAYAASKWGLTGFAKSLAEELKDTGLMSAIVLPGSIATDMLKGSPFPARMTADDVARSVEFLALDAPVAHNGACLEMFGV